MKRGLRRLGRLCGVLVLCASLAYACGDRADDEREADALGAAEWLASVRGAHAAADDAEREHAPEHALAALDAALELRVPPELRAAHWQALHKDLWFRAARLQLAMGYAQLAEASSERGLALGRTQDLFTANLLVVRGEARQAQSRDTEAAASYYEALEINRALLRAALAQPDAGAP